MVDGIYSEIVRVRPKPGTTERLLEMRDDLVEAYRREFPDAFISARLLAPEDSDTWVDLWFWSSKAEAEAALSQTERFPLFGEWVELVESVQFEWAGVLHDA